MLWQGSFVEMQAELRCEAEIMWGSCITCIFSLSLLIIFGSVYLEINFSCHIGFDFFWSFIIEKKNAHIPILIVTAYISVLRDLIPSYTGQMHEHKWAVKENAWFNVTLFLQNKSLSSAL